MNKGQLAEYLKAPLFYVEEYLTNLTSEQKALYKKGEVLYSTEILEPLKDWYDDISLRYSVLNNMFNKRM